LLIDSLLIICVACYLGEENGWKEQQQRGEWVLQQLNKGMYVCY